MWYNAAMEARRLIKRAALAAASTATVVAGTGFRPPTDNPNPPGLTAPEAVVAFVVVSAFAWVVGTLADSYFKKRHP